MTLIGLFNILIALLVALLPVFAIMVVTDEDVKDFFDTLFD